MTAKEKREADAKKKKDDDAKKTEAQKNERAERYNKKNRKWVGLIMQQVVRHWRLQCLLSELP